MEDFKKFLVDDIAVNIVNITRATYKEAGELKKILRTDISMGFKKIIIDLSICEFIDSTFIGVLVVTLKEISQIGGELRIVKPPSLANTVLKKSKTLDFFNVLETVDQAIKNFQNLDYK